MGLFRPGLPDLRARLTEPDARDSPWYQLLAEIADLRASDTYGWADDTLAGIAATVERTRRVTARQRAAVTRIAAAERFPSRNYDPFGYRRRWR